MAKPRVTRTYGPIHFEDLDPLRFEDLIRELIYDFKDWQSIEATGRSGNDEGFDVRAYEKAKRTQEPNDEEIEADELNNQTEGNSWMIQGKREKAIGPKKVEKILSDIDPNSPPYGYILAASVNFSKTSYDVFRNELRNKGVMEFHLWGKAELEDMLHMAKNDRILFTFFGISLVSKRRTRTSEIRSLVSSKNKLFNIVGNGSNFFEPVLIRDINDINYPYEFQCSDFKSKPPWKEYPAFGHHPLGLWCHNHKYFAYFDKEKKEYDFTKAVDLTNRRRENDTKRKKNQEIIGLINDFYDYIPRENRGHFAIDCLVKYSDILLIDDKGDMNYNMPHLFVDFSAKNGPFAGCIGNIEISNQEIEIGEDYKRINFFPKKFSKIKNGKIYRKKSIKLNEKSLEEFKNYRLDTIYELDGKYDFLQPRDIIKLDKPNEESEEEFIQITHKFKINLKDCINKSTEPYKTENSIKIQLGEISDNPSVNVYEFKRIYKCQFEKPPKKNLKS